MRLGVDIERVKRFEKVKDDTFLKKVFTDAEIEYAFNRSIPAEHLCGFFCAKEAYIKACGQRNIDLKRIEVWHQASGVPKLRIKSDEKKDLEDKDKILVSISHTNEYATAVVIIE